MDVTITKDKITITLPISPRTSASGKSTIIATTGGNKISDAVYKGNPVVIGCNCYVPKRD